MAKRVPAEIAGRQGLGPDGRGRGADLVLALPTLMTGLTKPSCFGSSAVSESPGTVFRSCLPGGLPWLAAFTCRGQGVAHLFVR